MRYKLTIAYDGTHYAGWQVQPNGLTIQELIESALAQILQKKIRIAGSGRTDSGVHALEQVAHFDHEEAFDLTKTRFSLNQLLPKDVRVLTLEKAPDDFHARFSAKGKTYTYHLYLGEILKPFDREYIYHYRKKLDLDLLQKAASHFIGTKDFKAFSNEPDKGSAGRNSVRTLHSLKIDVNGPHCTLTLHGNGFLYKMVRNIVGTLLAVASQKLPLEDLPKIFASRDRKEASRCAPARGLFLTKVHYL